MKKRIYFFLVLTIMTSIAYGQKKIRIDGDEIFLRDSIDGTVVLLTSIKRGEQNSEALWIKYDRRPGIDPWIKDPIEGLGRYSDENFIQYLHNKEIPIFGTITTYDDCLCAKNKTTASPDMYLIYFKISVQDWIKLKELYPEMESYSKIVK